MFASVPKFSSLAAVAAGLLLLAAAPARAQLLPTLAAIDPFSAPAGSAALTATLIGGGFVPGATVYWAGQPLTTTYGDTTRLTAQVPAQLLANSGQVSVFVFNPNGGRSNSITFTITASAVAIAPATLPGAVRNTAYSFTFTATGGNPPYAWSADGLPTGLTLSEAGLLSGTPTATGTFNLNVRVTDVNQRVAVRSFPLVVAAPPLSITSPDVLPQATEGVEYNFVFGAAPATTSLRWSVAATAGLPAGLALSTDGILRGTPTTRGRYTFSVQVTDAAGTTANKTVSLTIAAPPLTITTVAPLFSGSTGTFYSQTFSAAGGTPPYTWALRSPVPSLQMDTASGVLSGTPTQTGSFPITVVVTDSTGGSVTKDFTVVIGNPQLRVTNNSPLPSATVGTAYQQRFLATGGQSPYTWSITSGAMPGVVLDPTTGILAGTPTAPGTFNLTVVVRDNGGTTASRAFAVTVAAGPLQLVSDPAAFSTVAGEAFSATMTASGGTPPYTWSANGLPEGIELDSTGVISGSPRIPGSYLFTVRVTDAARASATDIFRLEVTAPAVPALTLSGVPDVSNPADQSSFRIQLASAYSLPLTGQLTITFAPDAGSGDPAVQFATGGRTLDFRIPAGATEPEGSVNPVGLQTGTVAGTVSLLMRLQTPGAVLTPTPVTLKTIRVERSAPVITSASFTRTGTSIEIQVNGYSTTREITQGVFRFRAATGNTLSTSEITLSLDESFGRWFRDAESTRFGGQFTFTQQFAIQGDAALVSPVSVTLTNRSGNTTYEFR